MVIFNSYVKLPEGIGDGWGLIGFTTVIIGYDDDTMGLFGC